MMAPYQFDDQHFIDLSQITRIHFDIVWSGDIMGYDLAIHFSGNVSPIKKQTLVGVDLPRGEAGTCILRHMDGLVRNLKESCRINANLYRNCSSLRGLEYNLP